MKPIALTAILNLFDSFDTIRKTIHMLALQTVRDQLEVIIVTHPHQVHDVDESQLQAFAAYQVIGLERFTTGAQGWAAGVFKARAPIVVFCEDHSFPEANWAETLIDAHRGDYAAVAPAIENGNPDTVISWANFALTFLEWFAPDTSREVEYAPGHNTSYKRDVLARYGDELAARLNPERVLHYDLRARGEKIFLDARTSTRHYNISLLAGYIAHSWHGGRLFGASRSQAWSTAHKLMYTIASPLIPFIRILRILRLLDTPVKRRTAKFWRALPCIVAGLYCHAAGEVVGYWRGAGDAMSRYMAFELQRRDFVRPSERVQLTVEHSEHDQVTA